MIIKITNYPVGIHAISFEKSVKEFQLGDPFVDNLILDCKLDKSHHQIVIECNLTIYAQLNCDSCNEKYRKELNSKFTILYLFDKSKIVDDDINVKYLSVNADKIDLTEEVFDYAYLSLPMKKLCSENCKGLCIKCGTNLNENNCNCSQDIIDPVWEPILKLKDKLK